MNTDTPPSPTSPKSPVDSDVLSSKEDVELDEMEDVTVKENWSTTSAEETITDPFSDDLLRIDASGCRGALERIPLAIKLIVMSTVTLVGMIAIGAFMLAIQAQQLRTVNMNNQFQTVAKEVGYYVKALQDERTMSLSYLGANASNTEALAESRAKFTLNIEETQSKYAQFRSKALDNKSFNVRKKTNIFADVLTDMKKYEDLMFLHRESVFARNKTTSATMMFYNEYLEHVLKFLNRFAWYGGAQSSVMSYALLTRIIEIQELLRTLGSQAFSQGTLTPIRYRGFYFSVCQRKFALPQWRMISSPTLVDYYDQKVSETLYNDILNMEKELVEGAYGNRTCLDGRTVTPIRFWVGNMTLYTTALRDVQEEVSQHMKNDAKQVLKKSVVNIAMLIFLIIFFFILATFTSVLLATTIIGPWRRLNKQMEMAISKFVPKGFLRLLGCERITQVDLGQYVEKELTIVNVDIRDFSRLAKLLKKEEIFDFLNKYLNYVGPLIRKHHGFIDKHHGDAFTALFPNPKHGMAACIEVQTAINAFNVNTEKQYPPIRIGVGVHSGSVLVGTVGENERMEGTIISPHAGVSSLLDRLTTKFNAKILTTRQALDKCRKFIEKHTAYRTLGRIVAENERGEWETIEVCEILKRDTDAQKVQSKRVFEAAVAQFQKGVYEEALKLFDEALAIYPDDTVASLYKKRAQQLLNQCKFSISNLQLDEVLQNEHLCAGMHDFCKLEYSSENIDLWKVIENYKVVDSELVRRRMAETIQKDYLSLSGLHTVNINQRLKDSISSQLDQSSDASPTLFNALQQELEIVMGDTLKRYRTSPQVFQAFNKCPDSPPKPSLDEL